MTDSNPRRKRGITENDWAGLKRFTPARIALGRAGISLPTRAHLEFQLCHAQARDAVHIPLNRDALTTELNDLGLTVIPLHSRAPDRPTYLQRPDLGRRLDADAGARLKRLASEGAAADVALVLADGLSSTAVQHHAAAMLARIVDALRADGLSLSPVCLVEQGRVAVGDEIGELLGARMLVLLVGERPGLSAPDSLGIYYTWNPRVGLTDAARNCISNIRPGGLSVDDATRRLAWLIRESRRLGCSGVALKDGSGEPDALDGNTNFLLE